MPAHAHGSRSALFRFEIPQVSELKLLTAFFELLAGYSNGPHIAVGLAASHGILTLRIPGAEVSQDRVRSALLDALEHRHAAPGYSCAAMFFPNRSTQATLALTQEGFSYDPAIHAHRAIASFAQEFLASIDPPEPLPNRLRPSSHIAIRSSTGNTTYEGLLTRAGKLASRLIRRGVKPRDLVALELERSADLVAAILGIWQVGAAYVPIDPAYPEARKTFLCHDSGATLTVTAADFNELDSECTEPARPIRSDSLAYVIYTSGSTGEPKGVPVTHAALTNFLESVRRKTGVSPADHFIAVTTLSFDIAAMELLLPLAAGASLTVAGRDEASDGHRLAQILEQQRATFLFGTPAMWRLLLDAGWQGSHRLTALCGGEAMTRALADALLPKTKALWNMYGPTETTIASAMARVEPGSGPIPIGRALAKTQLYIRDGELWIGGAGVARGYLNRPELTAAKFTPDGLFRTGDLVRFLPDGSLEFLGRADSQLKIRGFRVEPGEIEAALLRFPGIREAVVIAQAESLAAFIIPAQFPGPLRDHLAAVLPPHLVPDNIVALDAFPLTPSGKLDRRALSSTQPEAVEPFQAPETAAERALATMFAEVLRLDRVSVTANFFHLGGHSLLAAQVLARVWDLWQVRMPARVLFEAPSVRSLATRILAVRGAGTLPLPTRPHYPNPPLSHEQERFWLLHAFHREEQALYNIPAKLLLTGPLDPERLTRALNRVIARHEPLRARFENVEGTPVQTVLPSATVAIPIQTAAAAQADASRPFDLRQAPLLRASLVELGPERWQLLLTLHHIVADGWSMGVLFRELSAAYRNAPLPALQYKYSDYAHDQRRGGRSFEADIAYWREQLSDPGAPLQLTSDRPRGDALTYRGAQVRFEWTPELAEALLSRSRREGVTPFILLLAVFQVLMHGYTGMKDLVVGTPVANRSRVELEPLIGPFVNTLPLRTRLRPAESFRALLRQARQTALDGFAHAEVPFQRLVEELKPERSLAYTPFFQAMFALQNAAANGLELPGIVASEARYQPEWVKLDLSVNIERIEPAFRGSIDYNRDLFDPARMDRLAVDFCALLERVLAEPDATVADLACHPALAQLEPWNRTEAPIPSQTFLERFQTSVLESPNRIAVECDGQILTYAELDRQASHLARNLKTGHPIRVLVRRDLNLIPQLLAAWKAGACYVPLDPEDPAERLNLIERDLEATASSEGLAYVIYTSGSTGKPKGVRIRRESLLNLLEAMRVAVPFHRNDIMLAVAPAAFDMSVPELWLPLYCGAKLVLATDQDRLDPKRLRVLLETTGVTVMQGTPALWAALLDQGWLPPPGFKLLVGAEALPRNLSDRLAQLDCTVWNMYGPTETCVWSTMARVTGGPVSIGCPISNTRVRVLDSNRRPVPVGVAGELYIAGAGVADGYWNRPELTAERFVTLLGGERAYRTGDLVRFRKDGQLEFLRRLDTQVKLRGFRIELGEVEMALTQTPGITAAAAVVRGDSLYAWYTGSTHIDPRVHLARILPGYMVPSRLFSVELLPRNARGKLDRDALQVATEQPVPRADLSANSLERTLLEVWREVLNAPNLTVTDGFFEHGGHSLSAMRLIARIRQETGEELPLYRLFTVATVRETAAYLESHSVATVPAGLTGIQPRGTRKPIFFFNVQAGCWKLAHALGHDQPLFGVNSNADALTAIRLRQSAGPYLFAAFGTGAEAALANAQRLAELGETVSAIVLLDAPRPRLRDRVFSQNRTHPACRAIHFRSADLPGPVFETPAVEQIARELRRFT